MAENCHCQSCARLKADRQALREALRLAQPIVVEYLREVVNGSNQAAALLACRTLAAIRGALDRSDEAFPSGDFVSSPTEGKVVENGLKS